MTPRRKFLSTTLKLAASLGLLLTPGMHWLKTAYAVAKKTILPKDTRMTELVRKNPTLLDTRNLEPTPLQNFKTMGNTSYPVDMEKWRLTIGGTVKRTLSLNYMEMEKLPSLERDVLLICPGFFAQQGRWKGIDMQHLLDMVTPDEKARQITFSGPVGSYKSSKSFSIDLVRSNQVFLAYQVNGKALPEKHGFPLRVVAEGEFGGDWVKYVNAVTIDLV